MSDNKLLTEKPALTLAAARKIIAAAEAEALKNAWPVVIAVVDDGGHLLCLERLDNAQFASVEIAIQKARAAIAFKRPTKVWEEMLASGQQRVLNLAGVVTSEGGVPLRSAMNEVARAAYVKECTVGVGRWNRLIEKAGLEFRLRLPRPRRVGVRPKERRRAVKPNELRERLVEGGRARNV